MEGIELGRVVSGLDHAPIVYFLRVGDRVKIGTTTNLRSRIDRLSFSLVDVAWIRPGGLEIEQREHARWAEYRVDEDREWFYVRGGLAHYLRGTNARRRANFESRRILKAVPGPIQADGLVTLREAIVQGDVSCTLPAIRKARSRDPEFPQPVIRGAGPSGDRWRPEDLAAWDSSRARARTAV